MRIIIVSSAPLQAKPTPGLTGEDSLQYRVLGDLIGFPPDLARDADLLLLSGYPIDGRLVGALESCSAGAPHCAPVPVLAAPTPAQVVAGVTYNGVAPLNASSTGSIAATTTATMTLYKLTSNVVYDIYFVAKDGSGNGQQRVAVADCGVTRAHLACNDNASDASNDRSH
jgi:hypothetical protein